MMLCHTMDVMRCDAVRCDETFHTFVILCDVLKVNVMRVREAEGGPRHLSRDFGCGRIEHESLHGVVSVPQELIVVEPTRLHSEGQKGKTHDTPLLPFVCMGRNRKVRLERILPDLAKR